MGSYSSMEAIRDHALTYRRSSIRRPEYQIRSQYESLEINSSRLITDFEWSLRNMERAVTNLTKSESIPPKSTDSDIVEHWHMTNVLGDLIVRECNRLWRQHYEIRESSKSRQSLPSSDRLELSSSIKAKQHQLMTLRQTVESQRERITNFEKMDYLGVIQSKDAELAEKQSQIQNLKREKGYVPLMNELKKSRQETDRYLLQIELFKEEKSKAERQTERQLTAKDNVIRDLKYDISKLTANVEKQTEAILVFERQNKQLISQVKDLTESKSRSDIKLRQLTLEVEDLKRRNQQLRENLENTNHESNLLERKRLQEEIDELQEEVKEQKALVRLKERQNDEQAEEFHKETEENEMVIRRQRRQIDELEEKLASYE